MFDIDPQSKLGRRLKMAFYIAGVVLIFMTVAVVYLRRWRNDQGGDGLVHTKIRLQAIEAALATRHFMKGKYPSSEEGGLKLMFQAPKMMPLRFKDFDKDPPTSDYWKNEIQYLCPGEHNRDSYDLWSLGEDGKDGTEDDITNW